LNIVTNENRRQEIISLTKFSRILFICGCVILALENGFLLATFGYGTRGVLFLFLIPVDAIAVIFFVIALFYEFYKNRLNNSLDFLYLGGFFLVWSILTILWRFLLPGEVTGSETVEGGWYTSILIFLIASIWLSLALWKFITLLDEQTAEGYAIQQLKPNMNSKFHLFVLIYIVVHQVFSIIAVIGIVTGVVIAGFGIAEIGLLVKAIIVPVVGVIVYGFIPILYMNHKMANIKRVTIPKIHIRDYTAFKRKKTE